MSISAPYVLDRVETAHARGAELARILYCNEETGLLDDGRLGGEAVKDHAGHFECADVAEAYAWVQQVQRGQRVVVEAHVHKRLWKGERQWTDEQRDSETMEQRDLLSKIDKYSHLCWVWDEGTIVRLDRRFAEVGHDNVDRPEEKCDF